MWLQVVITVAGALISETVFADAEKFADPNAVATLPVSGVSSVGYVTMALAIVLALIYGAAWLLRRVKSLNGGSQSRLNVVEAISVGAKERVVLVRIKDRHVLLGVAPGQVNMLLDVGSMDVSNGSSDSSNSTDNNVPHPPTFKQLLKKSMGMS